jgi:hypothetical protein
MLTISLRALATAGALAALSLLAPAQAAQDRSQLKIPNGLSFAEFKGYETWQPVAVSQVPGSLKLISANPVMIAAYRKGLPAKGQKFPDGSRVVKIEWKQKANAASPYPVQVPDTLASVAFIVKDLKRFPKTNGWAYAKFDMDPKTGNLKPEGTGAECGYACHTTVAAQDYIFTAYPPR